MRIVSLLPAATEIVFALGLGEELVGATHRCDWPPEALAVPRLTGPDGLALGLLLDADPELVITGTLDDGCPDPRAIRELLDGADIDAGILTLAPASVEGIFNAISTVGAMTEAEDEAMELVEGLRERLKAVEEIVVSRRDTGFNPPRVAALEAVRPPRSVGRWVPDQVRLAGGWELLGHEGGPSAAVTWAAISEMDPEILVLMTDAPGLPAAAEAWEATPRPDGWDELGAVTGARVFVVDSALFARPGPRIVDGIEALAELVDPVAFDGMAPPESWARVR